jgi:O-antigen/teichoic acid export membrane protein
MGIVIKQSIRTISITITGALLGLFINVLSMKYFSTKDFGFTQNLVKIGLMLSYFCMLGFFTTLVVYGQKYPPDHEKRKSFLTISIAIPFISTLIITFLYFILKNKVIHLYHSGDEEMMSKYYFLFPLLTILTSVLLWMESYLQSLYKTAIQSFAREILNRIIYIALIILYAYQIINYDSFIWWYVILYLVPIIYLGYYISKTKGFEIGYNATHFSKKEIFHLIAFSFNQTFVVISIVLITQIDTLLTGPLAIQGLGAVAIYGMAVFAIGLIKNPIRAMSAAALPALSKNYQDNDIKSLKKNYNKSVITIQMLVLFCAFGMLLCINEIQYLIDFIKPGYESVGLIVLILLIGNVFDMIGGLNMEIITLSKYFKYNTIYSFIGLGVIIGMIFLTIDKYGLYGVAWSSSAGIIVYAILKQLFLYRKYGITPYSLQTLKLLGITLVSFIVVYLIPMPTHPILQLIIKGAIFSCVYVIGCIRWSISEDINNVITKFAPLLKRKDR